MPKLKNQLFETTFTSYRVISLKGGGGSGKVVKVKDERGETFAIKYLSPENISTEKVKRFKNELTFCEKNNHDNIIKVLDRGHIVLSEKKCPFYVMPYYDSNLRELVKSQIPIIKVLPYFSQILKGVEAAHLQNVWHRDLKPENILFDTDKEVLVVADFGIAHFTEPLLHTLIETKPLTRLANFQYAAPEQVEKSSTIDHRADIYALGLILNQMFTSKLARGTGYKRIGEIDSNYKYLDELADSMLSQSPSNRPHSIEEINHELIARGNDFISRQKLSKLKQTVIPDTDIDDPLVIDPPRLIDKNWEPNGILIMTLNQKVNQKWAECFKYPGAHSAILEYGPETFNVEGNRLYVGCEGRNAQGLINHTKEYINLANRKYKELLESEAQLNKAQLEAEMRQRIALEEKAREVNRDLEI